MISNLKGRVAYVFAGENFDVDEIIGIQNLAATSDPVKLLPLMMKQFDPYFTQIIAKTQENWRLAVSVAVTNGIAVPAIASSLAYNDSYRSARLPANLLQAQRDFFGAHTYERIDKPVGQFFHTEWMQ